MADVVNLRLARKARKRCAAEAEAAANRAKFGATKAARALVEDTQERRDRALDDAELKR